MIITELLDDYTPRLGKPDFRGKLAKIKKFITSRIKKVSRLTKQFARRQYLLNEAMRDMRVAVSRNEDIAIAGLAGSFIVAYGFAITATEFVITTFGAAFEMADTTGVDTGLITLAVGMTLFGLGSLLAAFCLNFLSIAIMDGANRKVYRTIRSTLRRSLTSASRVANAWALLGIILAVRAVAILILAYVYGRWVYDFIALPLPLLLALGLGAAVWLAIAALRYSLVPYVALFEPQLLLADTFARSRSLVKKQAWLFLITVFTVFAAYLAVLERVSEMLINAWGAHVNLVFIIGSFAGVILLNCALVMLYGKRKRARTS